MKVKVLFLLFFKVAQRLLESVQENFLIIQQGEKMKTVFNFATTAMGLAILGTAASAAEVSFSGFLDADVAGYYNLDTTSKNLDLQANHELDLTATVKVNDKVSVDIYATSYTTGPTGGTVPAQGSDAENRWTGLTYDGFIANIQATQDLKFRFGDLCYTAGQFNYYGYKRAIAYAVGLKETGFRGLEANYKGASLAAGADTKSTYRVYGAYDLVFGESNVKPFALYSSDQAEDTYSLRAGLDGTIAFSGQKIKIAYGAYKDKGDELSHAIAVEPILSFGSVSLAATAFVAILDDKDPTIISVPEWMFFYVEPGYAFNSVFSVGLPLEYHTMTTDSDADLSEIWTVPTAYFALGEGFTWSIWGQSSFRIGSDIDNTDPYFGLGSEVILSF
ncbi:MAG: hypothetical protein AUK31_04330 [Fibrobacteres bacterium CG2_30_45_31]|nr:MAG: hypothetical protein AUK31_04330 [Fibrobacteres bacterium CG2_30_45_31]